MTPTAYKLQAEGIHKSYGSNHVLRGVTLTAKAGDVISLIGSSGSGKSTLLRCINLLEKRYEKAERCSVADKSNYNPTVINKLKNKLLELKRQYVQPQQLTLALF